MLVKSTVQSILGRLGYTLVRANGSPSTKTMLNVLTHVSRLGFRPATVIDVGVGSGTHALYKAFPSAYHVMIEPVAEFEADIRSLLRRYRGEMVAAAASSHDGEIEIHVHPEHLDGSSILCEQMGPGFDGVTRKVRAVTIDKLVADEGLEAPYLIKVDVQGAELEVLDGAPCALASSELVLLEVSLFRFLKGAPQFFEVISYMKERGFVAYDIFGGGSRPLDGALAQCDLAFVKDSGMFRTSHAYASSEQWTRRYPTRAT